MKTLATKNEIRDIKKALIVNMIAADPYLVSWLKGLMKTYGE